MQGLVVDPAAGGNMLRYVNDAMGFPEGYRNTVATVEVFDYATLRPHIFFYTTEDIKAGEELLMDYGVVSVLTSLPFPPLSAPAPAAVFPLVAVSCQCGNSWHIHRWCKICWAAAGSHTVAGEF